MAGKLTCVNIETTQASSVVAPAIAGPDSDWRIDGDGGDVTGYKFRKLPDGMVEIELNGQTFTGDLPVGYRPVFVLIFPVIDATQAMAGLTIDTDGSVSCLENVYNLAHQRVSFFAEA